MKKLFITITLLFALVGSTFAQNFVSYGWFKNEKAGAYELLIDIDAREPFDIEKESIKHFLFLQRQEEYQFVKVRWYEPSDDIIPWCIDMSEKHNIYRTLEIYEDFDIEERVCSDGSIIQYVCYKNKEEK